MVPRRERPESAITATGRIAADRPNGLAVDLYRRVTEPTEPDSIQVSSSLSLVSSVPSWSLPLTASPKTTLLKQGQRSLLPQRRTCRYTPARLGCQPCR